MRKETDLDGVKAIAKTLLMTAVNQTPYSPMLVQHPFTSSGLVVLPKTGFAFKNSIKNTTLKIPTHSLTKA